VSRDKPSRALEHHVYCALGSDATVRHAVMKAPAPEADVRDF